MKIGIIGGGITGLTTALALHKVGIPSVVYEQAKAINTIGAGIWIQPNAVKVLDWLGIKDEIRKLGMELNKMEITNEKLVTFKKIKSEVVQDAEGNKTIAIHRGRLQNLLYNEVMKVADVKLNKTYISHAIDTDGINIKFQDGEDKVDVLLGADGIDSTIRKALFPNSSLRSTGQVCWRGISKMELPDDLKYLGREAWGKQVRFGFSQIADDEVYWFAVANADQVKQIDGADRKAHLKGLFQNFSAVVSELIDNTESTAIHETILQDLNRLSQWHSDAVCLLGDAAHATTPNMGQGACQGIEDAYYISRLLSQSGVVPGDVFQEFELKRRKKVDYIVNTSWQFGKMAHSRFGQPIMKVMLKMTPESVLNSQMNKLYALEG